MKKNIKKVLRIVYKILRTLIKVRWFKTVRVNFALLPFNQAIKFPILITGKLIIDSLKGKVIFDCPIEFGLVTIGRDNDNMPIATNPSRLFIDGILIFKGRCCINHSTNLVVWPKGKMELGKFVMTMSGVLLKSTYYIKIGDYTRLTSGSFVMDTNIHLVKDINTGIIGRVCKPIEIGKGCWIGMNTSILGGTKLPDYCITSRYSFLSKDYVKTDEPGTMFAGSPAKAIKKNVQRLFNIELERVVTAFFIEHPDVKEYQGDPGLEIVDENDLIAYFRI